MIKKYSEIIKYIFWGGMTTVVSWGSYGLLATAFTSLDKEIQMFGLTVTMDVLLSNILSWICAVLFAFVTNKVFVFESKSWKGMIWVKECIRFVVARLATGLLEIVMVPFLVAVGLNQKIFNVNGMLAKILVSIIVVIVNYIFGKMIFKKDKNTR